MHSAVLFYLQVSVLNKNLYKAETFRIPWPFYFVTFIIWKSNVQDIYSRHGRHVVFLNVFSNVRQLSWEFK